MTSRPRPHTPPWWPDDEPWPPRQPWPRPRYPFQRRFGGLLLALLSLLFFGLVSLLRFAFGDRVPPHGTPWPLPLLFIAFVFVFVFLRTMRRVGRPMSDVVSAAERVAAGDFTAKVTPYGPPWLRSVAAAFNRMTSTLERQQQQRRDLMADVAHELRTPLSVMQGRLEGMVDGVYPHDAAQIAQVLDETRLLARLVEDLRTLAHSEAGTLTLQREPTDLGVLVADVAALLSADAAARRVRLETDVPADLPVVDIDPLRVREVITNLAANALRHTPPDGTVRIAATVRGGAMTIRVQDTGPGIAPEDLPRIFDRFYKGPTSTGSGLGLTIARNLVAAHGGTLTADSTIGMGTTMTVDVPGAAGAETS